MLATLNIVTNPFNPARDRIQKPVTRRITVAGLVKKHKIDLSKPTICLFNGKAVLRADWKSTKVRDNDVVTFVRLPEGGGGGTNPLRMVLMVAVMVFAPQIGFSLAGGAAGTGFATAGAWATGSIVGGLTTAGITMAGMMLVNALIPPPKPPAAQRMADLNASPTYTLQAQGNSARIGQPIPVVYGRHIIYPDFAAIPYTEFEGNDQFLYQLFCIGQGEYLVHMDTLKVEDTPITSFPDVEYEILGPGEPVTLFPTGVITSVEVSGQEIPSSTGIGPFVLNPADTEIDKIALDIVCPRGLYYANDSGSLSNVSVSFSMYAEPIDEYGNPTGSEILLSTETISGSTATAIRKTYKFDVPAGRYRCRVVRVTPKETNSRYGNDLVWAGARGYLTTGTKSYPGVTMLAIKMRANDSLSQQASRKINVEVTRKLPIPTWNEDKGEYEWSEPQPTRNVAWAIADVLRAHYGANAHESRIDMPQLMNLALLSDAREDYFDAIFDSPNTLWEALSSVARAIRARPYVQAGMVHFVRDQLQTLPTALFTSRNIVKGSFKITYVMPSEDSSDCVEVEYLDRVLWKPRTVLCALEGLPSDKPAQIKAFGITDRAHAWREGMYMAAKNRYCRKEISFETELEGHIPSLGDLIAIQSDIPNWGQSGEVIAVDGRTLTLSEPLKWSEGLQHYIMLRRADGSGWGAAKVNRGAEDNIVVVDASEDMFDFPVYTGTMKDRTHFTFGPAGQVTQLARVTAIKPRSRTVQISCVNEDVRVHSADGGSPPPDFLDWSLTTPSLRPVLTDLTVVQTGSGTTPTITVSWSPAAGATRYILESSVDGENWSSLAEVTSHSFSFMASQGTLFIRAAAFGSARGPWIQRQIVVGEVPPPADVATGAVNSDGPSFQFSWGRVDAVDGYVVQVVVDGNVKREALLTDTFYHYSWEMAYADGGPWRTVKLRVKARKGGILSQNWYEITGTNAAPLAPTILVKSGVKSLAVEVSTCREPDYEGTIIWGSTDQHFVPDESNKLYEGRNNFFVVENVAEQMWFVAAHYDTYGRAGLNYSSKMSATPSTAAGITNVTDLPSSPAEVGGQLAIFYEHSDPNVRGIYAWDGGQWVRVGDLLDGAVTEPKIADNAIVARHIVSGQITAEKMNVNKLSAITADMGDITSGSLTINQTGFIRGGASEYGIGTGFWQGYHGGSYKWRVGQPGGSGAEWDGTTFKIYGPDGSVTLASGDSVGGGFSSWGELTGSLGKIDSSNVSTIIADAAIGSAQIGSIALVGTGNFSVKTATSGARMEMDSRAIKVFDANGIKRVQLGDLTA